MPWALLWERRSGSFFFYIKALLFSVKQMESLYNSTKGLLFLGTSKMEDLNKMSVWIHQIKSHQHIQKEHIFKVLKIQGKWLFLWWISDPQTRWPLWLTDDFLPPRKGSHPCVQDYVCLTPWWLCALCHSHTGGRSVFNSAHPLPTEPKQGLETTFSQNPRRCSRP